MDILDITTKEARGYRTTYEKGMDHSDVCNALPGSRFKPTEQMIQMK